VRQALADSDRMEKMSSFAFCAARRIGQLRQYGFPNLGLTGIQFIMSPMLCKTADSALNAAVAQIKSGRIYEMGYGGSVLTSIAQVLQR